MELLQALTASEICPRPARASPRIPQASASFRLISRALREDAVASTQWPILL